MQWRDRASIPAWLLLTVLTAGCAAGGGASAPPTAASGASSDSSSLGEKISSFFSGSFARLPQIVAGAQPNINCPLLEIRRGASTFTIGPGGENATMSLKYQGEFVRVARECAVVGGNMVMKVGVQGRVIVGPAGGPGQVDVPLRIAVVDEPAGSSKLIVTKLIRIPVTIGAGQGNASFTHIEEGLSFPLPTPTAALDNYIVYVGFDPLATQEPKKPKAKPKPKAKTSRG